MEEPQGFSQYAEYLSRQGHNADNFNSKFKVIRQTHIDNEIIIAPSTENSPQGKRPGKRKYGEFSVLLRRIVTVEKDQERVHSQLEIQSNVLRSEFRKLASHLTSINLSGNTILISEPYKELYYCRDKVRHALENSHNEAVRCELQLLEDFQTNHMQETYQIINTFKKSGTIDFAYLWALFLPGAQLVYESRTVPGSPNPVIEELVSFEVHTRNDNVFWSITTTFTGYNGRNFGKIKKNTTHSAFAGTIKIIDLPIYPLEFCGHKDEVLRIAEERGRKYEQYCISSSESASSPAGTIRTYDGPIWTPRTDMYGKMSKCTVNDLPSDSIKGRVTVDYTLVNNWPSIKDVLSSDIEDIEPDEEELSSDRSTNREVSLDGYSRQKASKLTQNQLLTCPPLIAVFSFSSNKRGFALVDKLETVTWKPTVIEHLQFEESTKVTLGQIVRNHSSGVNDFDDFISGKGRGLVILLHGPPGCGKTMMAECIGEMAKKAVYNVAAGDLGSSSQEVQKTLQSEFRWAERWDAILLLDEADVFMEERHSQTPERTAVVSVLLRLLEYQKGVVFLTTNRIENFDKAILSRIHATVSHPKLSQDLRKVIWTELAKTRNCDLSDDEVHELSQLEVDGRKIKNILRLASLMAKDKDVQFADIRSVLSLAIGKD